MLLSFERRSLIHAVTAASLASLAALSGCANGESTPPDASTHRADAWISSEMDAPEPEFPDATVGRDAPTPADDASRVDTGPTCVDADGDGFSVGPSSCGQLDCDDADATINPGAVEVCNGKDDDCNGVVDDAIAEQHCGVGGCAVTVPGCTAGRVPTCTPGAPSTEICNAIDDDCDGEVDEGLGTPVVCGVGACERMVPGCSGGGTTTCTPGAPSPETCNGIDDDCDGETDEGLPNQTCGVGACARTMPTCVGGALAACTPGSPSTEVCNGVDDDCNGFIDDGFGTRTCGVGYCQRTVNECVSGVPQTCTPGSPRAETCNNIDDNCNGSVDEGLGTLSCGVGICANSVAACVAGVPQTCTPRPGLATEVCGNGLDDNCNGSVDEGCTPTNDLCGSAIVLSSAGGTRTGDRIDGAAQNLTASCGYNGGDVFYSITLSARSVLYVDTFGSSFDTTASIFAGCSGSSIACNDDSACSSDFLRSQVTAVLNPGTYIIRVASFASGATGTFNLRWQVMTAGAGPATLITGNGTYTGTTSATSGVTSSTTGAPCYGRGSGGEALHYFMRCPGATSSVTASTCSLTSLDSVLYLRNGANTELSCADDTCGLQTSIAGSAAGPGVFGIYVDSFSGYSQSYSVAVSGL